MSDPKDEIKKALSTLDEESRDLNDLRRIAAKKSRIVSEKEWKADEEKFKEKKEIEKEQRQLEFKDSFLLYAFLFTGALIAALTLTADGHYQIAISVVYLILMFVVYALR